MRAGHAHIFGTQGLAAAVDVGPLIPRVGLALKARPVDEEGVGLDAASDQVNVRQDQGNVSLLVNSQDDMND